jgi:hypothetical protein
MKRSIIAFVFLLSFCITYAGTAPCIQCASLLNNGKCIYFAYTLGNWYCTSNETVEEVRIIFDDPSYGEGAPECHFETSNIHGSCPD